ncbi:helix-turn-helix domain-containing protein [Salinigranum salinum]|uniref:helix-turn-helix domain-containing protein n=1 Tax=Salinigranum salinum TaxID=1364937 RepID=UPI001260C5F2|nr:helix-turn-helix domain-containing protein [Salinigranum salinum]
MTDSGVHAEMRVAGPSVCRVVDASDSGEVVSVSRATSRVTDEVTVEFISESGSVPVDAEEVFSYDGKAIYRFERPAGTEPACACEVIEWSGNPVRHTEVDDGSVVVSFVANDLDELGRIVTELKAQYEEVSLQCLTRSAAGDDESDLVFVDRAVLTARQREVLETAHEMGYFDHPKGANATEVAAALDINRSTFAEHLSAAQSKLLEAILET